MDDHIIPRARGGHESPQNRLVLCRPCNASKGTGDLLEWWQFKGANVMQMEPWTLCLYSRAQWQHYGPALLDAPITAETQAFLVARAAHLPTDAHRIALYGAAYAVCGLVRWLVSGMLLHG
jgi:hypothetical protein